MPAVKVPLNPSVLRWALSESGMSLGKLAQELELDPHMVAEWLTGQAEPNTTEFRKLAKVLRRPTSFFLLPSPPTRPTKSATLRVAYGASKQRPLNSDEIVSIRDASRRQRIAAWASNVTHSNDPIEFPPIRDTPEETAIDAQVWLNWSVANQFEATSKSAVTRMLRKAIEGAGIIVFQLSIGEEACRGFSLFDPVVPVIAYNSKGQIPSARNFTLLHELAHLLHGEQAVCGGGDSQHERWCDRFAAAFLMPSADLQRYVSGYLKLNRVDDNDIDSVRLISNRFKTSFQSVALRLQGVGLASWNLYNYVRSGARPEDAGSAFSREVNDTPVVRLREYGRAYAKLVLSAYHHGDLGEMDLRKYLNVNGSHLAKLTALVSEAE